MNDADFQRRVSEGLGRLAARAPAGPTPAEILRSLRLLRSRRIAWWAAAGSAAAAAAMAALLLSFRSAGTAAPEPSPVAPSIPVPTPAPAVVRKDQPKRPDPAPVRPSPSPSPTPLPMPQPEKPAFELVKFEPLPADVRTDVLRARLESLPMLTAGERVVLRKQPDAPLVLLINGGPAVGEAEAEAVADGLETLFAGFEEIRVTMEKGRVVSAILVRSRSGVTVRQTLTATPSARPKAGMARVVKM